MNSPTSAEEPRVTIEFSLSELRHLLSALIIMNNEPILEFSTVELNERMLYLLLQLEEDLVFRLNAELQDENYVREHGED